MSNRPNRGQSLAAILLSLVMAVTMGCTTLQSVGVSQRAAESQLKQGDHVVATLKDGSERSFEVTTIGGEALQGDGVSVAYDDMTRLQVKRFDGKKTALLVIPIVAVVAIAAGGGGGGYGGGGGSGGGGGY